MRQSRVPAYIDKKKGGVRVDSVVGLDFCELIAVYMTDDHIWEEGAEEPRKSCV